MHPDDRAVGAAVIGHRADAARGRRGAGGSGACRDADTRLPVDSSFCYSGSMKTTIDIPQGALQEAMRFTKAKTKREAVVTALEEFNRRRRMAEATRVLGTSTTFMAKEGLLEARRTQRTP